MDLVTTQANKDKSTKARQSVSAECFGNFNKKENFTAPFYEKSEEILAQLKSRLEESFMFSALNPEELKTVIGAV
jgi:cAMP-dependent protein kinase regulator